MRSLAEAMAVAQVQREAARGQLAVDAQLIGKQIATRVIGRQV